jgi:hypothetical protein
VAIDFGMKHMSEEAQWDVADRRMSTDDLSRVWVPWSRSGLAAQFSVCGENGSASTLLLSARVQPLRVCRRMSASGRKSCCMNGRGG